MSDTYDLACRDCNESIWIGQRGGGSKTGRIYHDDKTNLALQEFLFKHIGHRLKFDLSNFVLSWEENPW